MLKVLSVEGVDDDLLPTSSSWSRGTSLIHNRTDSLLPSQALLAWSSTRAHNAEKRKAIVKAASWNGSHCDFLPYPRYWP